MRISRSLGVTDQEKLIKRALDFAISVSLCCREWVDVLICCVCQFRVTSHGTDICAVLVSLCCREWVDVWFAVCVHFMLPLPLYRHLYHIGEFVLQRVGGCLVCCVCPFHVASSVVQTLVPYW